MVKVQRARAASHIQPAALRKRTAFANGGYRFPINMDIIYPYQSPDEAMKMSEGVEWALHCCLTLAWLSSEGPVPTSTLAAAFDVRPHYLNKFLQALVRAGVLTSAAGAKGGFRLARSPKNVSLLDVVIAIEGDDWAFRCTEIRQQGAGCNAHKREFARPCGIAAAMRKAEEAWRNELARQSLADLATSAPATGEHRMHRWYAARAR